MYKNKTVNLTGWENNLLQSDLHRATCSLKLTRFKSLGATRGLFLKKRKTFRVSKCCLKISKAPEKLKHSGQPFHSSNSFEVFLLINLRISEIVVVTKDLVKISAIKTNRPPDLLMKVRTLHAIELPTASIKAANSFGSDENAI